mmetsp:Transcript_55567/g.148147  ORF Transcript_55567/g.148147 Transcript_55567/m.148147 type:complete len:220 (-) Transcript_55567:52-711(-)
MEASDDASWMRWLEGRDLSMTWENSWQSSSEDPVLLAQDSRDGGDASRLALDLARDRPRLPTCSFSTTATVSCSRGARLVVSQSSATGAGGCPVKVAAEAGATLLRASPAVADLSDSTGLRVLVDVSQPALPTHENTQLSAEQVEGLRSLAHPSRGHDSLTARRNVPLGRADCSQERNPSCSFCCCSGCSAPVCSCCSGCSAPVCSCCSGCSASVCSSR